MGTEGSRTSGGQLGRAFDLLLAVGQVGPADAKVLAERVALPLSTTYRLLGVLMDRGFVQKRDGSYEVGWAPYFLANVAAASVALPHRAWPILKALSDDVGETALLLTRVNEHLVIVAISEASKEVRTTFPLGTHFPLGRGAAGRLFVAYQGAHPSADEIRVQGYATSDEEIAPGVRAIAAPVFDYLGALSCAIVVAGPSSRIDFSDSLIARTIEAADELSTRLGYGAGSDLVPHDGNEEPRPGVS
ncbi:MAG: IclR family transcriptional regulator [Acidimicrobiia bacterium]